MGIFGSTKKKISKKIDEVRIKREEKRQREDYENELDREAKQRTYSEATIGTAKAHMKNKAYAVMTNPNSHLSQKIKAINQFYHDDTKPKLSKGMQQMSDHAYINQYRKDMRMAKRQAIIQAVEEDKVRKINERRERQMQMAQRNEFLRSQNITHRRQHP